MRLGLGVIIPLVLIVVLWLLGPAFGLHISLFGSLAISLVLTVVLNLAMGAFGKRRSRSRHFTSYRNW